MQGSGVWCQCQPLLRVVLHGQLGVARGVHYQIWGGTCEFHKPTAGAQGKGQWQMVGKVCVLDTPL